MVELIAKGKTENHLNVTDILMSTRSKEIIYQPKLIKQKQIILIN